MINSDEKYNAQSRYLHLGLSAPGTANARDFTSNRIVAQMKKPNVMICVASPASIKSRPRSIFFGSLLSVALVMMPAPIPCSMKERMSPEMKMYVTKRADTPSALARRPPGRTDSRSLPKRT